MSGFVASAAATLAARGAGGGDPGCVMGYYDGADVPVYAGPPRVPGFRRDC